MMALLALAGGIALAVYAGVLAALAWIVRQATKNR